MARETTPQAASDDEYESALAEPNIDGELLPKLILAIIRANPDPKNITTDQARLYAAMRALLGRKYDAPRPTRDVPLAMRWMAMQYMRDRGGPGIGMGSNQFAWLEKSPTNARSVKELAKGAKERFGLNVSTPHLENLFAKDGKKLCQSMCLSSDIPITLQTQTLEKIRELLEPHGVRIQLNDDA